MANSSLNTTGSLCKACFSFEQSLYPLSGIMTNGQTVQCMLEALFPDILNSNNGVWHCTAEPPQSICLACKSLLEKAYEFQQQVIRTDKRIKKLVEAVKVDDTSIKQEQSTADWDHDYVKPTVAMVCVKEELVEEEPPESFVDVEWMNGDGGDEFDSKLEDTLEVDCYVKNEPTEILIVDTATHHPQPYYCDFCLKEFTRAEIEKHLPKCRKEVEAGQSTLPCLICKKRFLNYYRLERHLMVHDPSKGLTCNECCKTFSTKYSLQSHLLRHSGEKFACGDCGKSYTTKSALRVHVLDHTDEPKRFICNQCDMSFRLENSLKIHMKRHTGLKTFECIYCSMRFFENSDLTKHIKRHTGQKPHACKFCSMRFTESSDLTKHMRIHTKERPFHCQKCDKSFTLSSTFAIHRRMHEGIFQHQCDICGKGFYNKGEYNVHYRRHLGVKPHICSFCNYSSTDSRCLKKHLRTHF